MVVFVCDDGVNKKNGKKCICEKKKVRITKLIY